MALGVPSYDQDSVYRVRNLVRLEVSKHETGLAELRTATEYSTALGHILDTLIREIRSILPSCLTTLRQFGIVMSNELFFSVSRIVWHTDISGNAHLIPDHECLESGILNFPSIIGWTISGEDSVGFLELRMWSPDNPSSRVIETPFGCIVYLSEPEIKSLLNDNNHKSNSTAHLSDLFMRLMSGLRVEKKDGAEFWHAVSEYLPAWIKYQDDLGHSKDIFRFEGSSGADLGLGHFWYAVEREAPDFPYFISILAREFIRAIHSFELRTVLRAQWSSSAGKLVRERAVHRIVNALAGVCADIECLGMAETMERQIIAEHMHRNARSQFAIVREELQQIQREQNSGQTGLWRTSPVSLARTMESLLSKRERESCVFSYQLHHFEGIEGFLYSWPAGHLCQIAGPSVDLAASLCGFISNAIEAQQRGIEWNVDDLRRSAERDRQNGMGVIWSGAIPLVLVRIFGVNRYLCIQFEDGGPGLPEAHKEALASGRLFEPGPSEKQDGGRGIKQALLLVKSRYDGAVVFCQGLVKLQVMIPISPWYSRKSPRGFEPLFRNSAG